MNERKIVEYLMRLKSEISPAMGCTEPAAVALAAAYASRELAETPRRVEVSASAYILKNGMNVGIPGTGMTGIDIAAALGAFCAAPERQLMVLHNIPDEQKQKAVQLAKRKAVFIGLADSPEKVYIEVCVSGDNASATAVISGSHTGLTELRRGERVVYRKDAAASGQPIPGGSVSPMTLEEIVTFTKEVPIEEIAFLQEVLTINREISREGLTGDYGLKVGKNMMENHSLFSIDICNYAVACTAAAADARMAGCEKPVMSAAGSGNQGLTASIPVAAIGEKLDKPDELIFRSLALSILVTIHVKHHIGRLSVLCGCSIAAAIGSCCGIIYLLGGTLDNMKYGINTMVADISGVVCDGAKPGCALKIATAVSSAIRAATMAMRGLGANSHDGIVATDVETTLANLGTLGNEGMGVANAAILAIMLKRE